MAEDNDTVDMEGGESPARAFDIRFQNQQLLEKLKLLGYEKSFVKAEKVRPLERQSFSISSSTGESYLSFVRIAAWLIRQSGQETFRMPQELDDPNTTISGILSFLRSKERGGEWTVTRVKAGTGEEAVALLNALADIALLHRSLAFRRAEPREEAHGESEDEGGASSGDESDGEVEAAMDEDDAAIVDVSAPREASSLPQSVLKSDVTDVQSWKDEVERVTPLLKIVVGDGKEWRVRVEKMATMKKKMEEMSTAVLSRIDELAGSMEKSISVIETREKSLASQMSSSLVRLKEKRDELTERSETYKSVSGGIAERNKTLEAVADDIKQLKEHIDVETARNADGAPLVRVRQSLMKLEEESMRLSVQCAVAEQTLLHADLSERLSYSRQAYGIN